MTFEILLIFICETLPSFMVMMAFAVWEFCGIELALRGRHPRPVFFGLRDWSLSITGVEVEDNWMGCENNHQHFVGVLTTAKI